MILQLWHCKGKGCGLVPVMGSSFSWMRLQFKKVERLLTLASSTVGMGE